MQLAKKRLAFSCTTCGCLNYCKCKCSRCQHPSYGFWNKRTTCGRCLGRKTEIQTCLDCKGNAIRKGKKLKDLCRGCKDYIRQSAPLWPNRALPTEIVNAVGRRRRLTHRRDSPVMLHLLEDPRRANEKYLSRQRCKD